MRRSQVRFLSAPPSFTRNAAAFRAKDGALRSFERRRAFTRDPLSSCVRLQSLQTCLMTPMNRRQFLRGAAAGTAVLSCSPRAWSAQQTELDDIRAEIKKRHAESVQRLQQWIHQPSIAAENRGVSEGCDLTMQLFRDAGFQQVAKVPTDGQPGIFATLDA